MTVDSSPLLVGPAGPAELDAVAELFDAYRRFYGKDRDLVRAREFLEERTRRRESTLLVARASGAGAASLVVGFAQLYPSWSSLALAPTVILNDLYVEPGWRRRGVARRLVEAVRRHAAGIGAASIELATEHTNASARRLYATLGFVPDPAFMHLSLSLPPDE